MIGNSEFCLGDIYDKNINFLIGAGASHGLFPTLALKVKDNKGKQQTIESLATHFEATKDSGSEYTLLFMHYYKTCIEPAMTMDFESASFLGCDNNVKDEVLENYQKFLETLLNILQHRKNFERRCNLFTANYDGCFAHMADCILGEGGTDFVINDGARGFNSRSLQAKNFNSFLCQTGIFERNHTDIPQINLIHFHGSVYWYKSNNEITVDYSIRRNKKRLIDENLFEKLESFSQALLNPDCSIEDLPQIELKKNEKNKFWKKYNALPIVNPTKWKFHETVFEEHYYQMLRLLSYELEKPNTVFIAFGFSFADEHVLNLVKRSLSNPTLQLFISCFDKSEYKKMHSYFRRFKNVQYLRVENKLDFKVFNNQIFTNEPISEVDSKEASDGN